MSTTQITMGAGTLFSGFGVKMQTQGGWILLSVGGRNLVQIRCRTISSTIAFGGLVTASSWALKIWYAKAASAGGSNTLTLTEVTDPWADEAIGTVPDTVDRNGLTRHKVEFKVKTSTFDTSGPSYAQDAEVEVRVAGAVVFNDSAFYMTPSTSSGQTIDMTFGVSGGESHAGWALQDFDYASVTGEVITHADLLFADTFSDNDVSDWSKSTTYGLYAAHYPYTHDGAISFAPSSIGSATPLPFSGIRKTFTYTGPTPEPVVASPEIPTNDSSECCASPGLEGSGVVAPGAGVERPALQSAAWGGRCDGGGSVVLLSDLTDAEDWSDS